MAFMICDRHGGNPSADVSRDALDSTGQILPSVPFVLIGYDYEGQPAMRFSVTHPFIAKWQLEGMAILPLPDNFPPWISEMTVVCGKCFEEATGIDTSLMT